MCARGYDIEITKNCFSLDSSQDNDFSLEIEFSPPSEIFVKKAIFYTSHMYSIEVMRDGPILFNGGADGTGTIRYCEGVKYCVVINSDDKYSGHALVAVDNRMSEEEFRRFFPHENP